MLEMHLTTLFFCRLPFLIYRHFIHLSIYMGSGCSENGVDENRLRYCDTQRIPDRLSTILDSTLQE